MKKETMFFTTMHRGIYGSHIEPKWGLQENISIIHKRTGQTIRLVADDKELRLV